jgi:hypothetical protein
MEVDDGLHGKRLALVPESKPDRGSGFHDSPKSINEYASKGQTEGVIGIVQKGAVIQITGTKTKKAFSFWYGGQTEDTVIFGKIASGVFAGKRVDLNDVLHWPKKWLVPAQSAL